MMKTLSPSQRYLLLYLYDGYHVSICRDPKLNGKWLVSRDDLPHRVSIRTFAKLQALGLITEHIVSFYGIKWGQVILTAQGIHLAKEVSHAEY